MDRQKDNKVLLLEIKDMLYKLQQDVSIIKLELKVIKEPKKPEPISKGWFG